MILIINSVSTETQHLAFMLFKFKFKFKFKFSSWSAACAAATLLCFFLVNDFAAVGTLCVPSSHQSSISRAHIAPFRCNSSHITCSLVVAVGRRLLCPAEKRRPSPRPLHGQVRFDDDGLRRLVPVVQRVWSRQDAVFNGQEPHAVGRAAQVQHQPGVHADA